MVLALGNCEHLADVIDSAGQAPAKRQRFRTPDLARSLTAAFDLVQTCAYDLVEGLLEALTVLAAVPIQTDRKIIIERHRRPHNIRS
jgi:hypothetical protein